MSRQELEDRFCHARRGDKQAPPHSIATGDAMKEYNKEYNEWCQHYDYDPATSEARADYERYLEQLRLFQRLLEEPDFMEGDAPRDSPHKVNVPYTGSA